MSEEAKSDEVKKIDGAFIPIPLFTATMLGILIGEDVEAWHMKAIYSFLVIMILLWLCKTAEVE